MRQPQRKRKGDVILAEDWNLLLDAIAARTPRPGDGLKFISSSGGFAYSCPGNPSGQPGHPPFSVIGIAKAGGGYKVTIKEGWVIERLIKSGTSPAVKFWIPKYAGTALNATPRPELAMSLGDTAFCRVQCAVDGLITGDPTIVVSSATQNGLPYWPADPDASGQTGDYYVKLFTLASDAGTPKVTVYQQSDIEHWAQLWTGKNVGAEARVFKEHDETDNKYAFRTIKGIFPLLVEEDGDEIEVSSTGLDFYLHIYRLEYELVTVDTTDRVMTEPYDHTIDITIKFTDGIAVEKITETPEGGWLEGYDRVYATLMVNIT